MENSINTPVRRTFKVLAFAAALLTSVTLLASTAVVFTAGTVLGA